jgi:micrococcal nuclease
VINVVDGDTIDVRFQNGTTSTVRLLGVDTLEPRGAVSPEEFGIPVTAAADAQLKTEADAATRFVREQLAGEQVTLVSDPEADDRGSFDRLLRYVLVEGESINEALLRRGHARVFESSFTNRSVYRDLVTDAMAADRGVWSFEGSSRASAATSVAVSATQIDAPGSEFDNLDAETVTLLNTGNEPLSLAGWTVRDTATHVFTFGDRDLAPGETVTIVTGEGEATRSTVYWGRDAPVWNNNGDRVIVQRADGTTVQNASVSGSGVVTCRGPIGPIEGASQPPLDPDCDGIHEDTDGSGLLTILDVVTLLTAYDDLPASATVHLDLTGDGQLSILDVASLLTEID